MTPGLPPSSPKMRRSANAGRGVIIVCASLNTMLQTAVRGTGELVLYDGGERRKLGSVNTARSGVFE